MVWRQLLLDDAMTNELSQVLTGEAVRRLSRGKELHVQPECLLRMRWLLVWKYAECGKREATSRLIILEVSTPRTHECTDSGSDVWKHVSSSASPVVCRRHASTALP